LHLETSKGSYIGIRALTFALAILFHENLV